MIEAVCINCGSIKEVAYAKCDKCGFDPSSDGKSHVLSVYLSRAREALGIPEEALQAELAEASARIQGGGEAQID